MPREERFFDLFARHSQTLTAGAEALRGVLQGGESIAHYCQIVSDREQEADEITREVLEAVRRSFITPFGRSDIQDLITSMDDSIDQMHKTAKAITLLQPTASSATSSSSPPRCIPWATAATTPRRPWASSRRFSTRRGC